MIKVLRKIFYLILFSIIFIIPSRSYTQQYWLTLNSPTNQFLKECSFVDSLRGWVAGDSGTIIHTSNGGVNWVFQNTNIGYEDVVSIFFLNERLGWALSWDITFDTNSFGTNILSTTNGGINWGHVRYPVDDIFINTITFVDSLTGFLGGYPGIFVKTTNGGLNWYQVELDSSFFAGFPPLRFSFYNSQYGFACGGVFDIAGVIWKTTNYGESWISYGVGPEPIFDIEIFNLTTSLGVGGDLEYGPTVVRTTNSGTNWGYETLQLFGTAYALSFRTRAEGWAPLGFQPGWIYTIDSGETWDTYVAPDSSNLYDVEFTDYRNGFAVGKNGVIKKYNSALINISNNNQYLLPLEITLYQNYPNPFNPISKIKFYISKPADTKLVVYDVLGREVIVLLNEQLKQGLYEVEFKVSNLPSGLYFYQLTSGEFSKTRKMILLK